MYTIYKYEWDIENQVGGTVEIVLPASGSGRFICYYDTSRGVDTRVLREHAEVPEYAIPSAQVHCAVYTATIPFYGLGQLRKTLLHRALAHSLRRMKDFFIIGKCQVSVVHGRKFDVRRLADTYAWTLLAVEFQ